MGKAGKSRLGGRRRRPGGSAAARGADGAGTGRIEAPAAGKPSRRDVIILAVGMVLVTCCVLAAHWPSLSAEALCSDDLEYLVGNQLVQNPSWNSTRRFLTEVLRPSTVGGYYQPLSMISLMLDCAAGGSEVDPAAFHRTSLILHVVNTSLIVLLLYLLFGSPAVAVMGGLLFGVHPITVEPIPWISERKTLLAALFALLCLVFYVQYARRRKRRFYILALGAFILALMSKPTSTPLPVCMVLLDYWPLRRLNRRTLTEKIPFLAAAGLLAFVTVYSQQSTFGLDMPSKFPAARIPLLLSHNVIFYLSKMFWPVNLSPHYPFPEPMGLSHPMVLAGVIGTVVLLVGLVVALRWTPAPLVGWLFFFVAALPTMGVIGFTVVVASDKFAYLPSLGVLIVLASLLAWLWRKWPGRAGLVARCAVIAVIVALVAAETIATRATARHWRDTDTLNQHMLSLTPGAAWVHNCHAVNLIRTGRVDQAYEHLVLATELDPNYAEPHNSLGYVHTLRRDYDKAIESYQTAVKLRPGYATARRNLAAALAEQKARRR